MKASCVEKYTNDYKFSLIKNINSTDILHKSITPSIPRKTFTNNTPNIKPVFSKKSENNNLRNSVNISKNYLSINNKLGFVSHFGKGLFKQAKNISNENLKLINPNNNKEILNSNISNTINFTNIKSNKSINIDINSSYDSSEENKKNLKIVEKEIKNRLIDMSTIIQNRSFNIDHRKKDLDIFSIEEEKSFKKKKRRKKIGKKKKNKDINKYRKIIIKPPIFDSLDEDEEAQDNEDDDSFYIHPESNFIFTLDIFVLISTLICFIYTPIQIAFSRCFCIEESLFIKNIFVFIDIIFIFDFFINFFRAFYNYEYKLIKNIKKIIKDYFSGHIYFDFLESIPFNLLITYFCINKDKYKPDGPICFSNGINGIFSSIKVCSTLKIMKILKVMNKKRNSAYNWIQDIDDHVFEKIRSLTTFIFLSLASINVFICLHIFIGIQTYPNWIVANGFQNKSFIHIYIAALYGIIETLTTVGYGDVINDSFTEIIFQIILLSIGIVAYSWIITIIGNYVKNESKAEIKHSKDLMMLEEIRIEFPTMSFKLYNKIHQHLKSVSNQQKKIDLNILVNSLPYSIKNMVLFKIYNNCIEKFNFFKRCDNTDFISRVLTNFIPLFSMRKALLIREGENVDNIFFVKTGKLSLNVTLDRNNIEESIRKYIYEKFDDIMETETKCEKSINDTNEGKDSTNEKIEKVQEGIQNIFNHKRQSIQGQSYHESRIEQEIGKCDLGGNEEDIEESKHKFLRVIEIKRNEDFGLTYMVLNKPSPLSLRVDSKKADLFILRKHDVLSISKTYPSIWSTIYDNSFFNMKALKKKTIKILKIYCSCHGIKLNKKGPKKSEKLEPLNILEIKKLMELEKKKQEEEEKTKKKYVKSKSSRTNKQKSLKKQIRSHTQTLNQKEFIFKLRNKLIKKYSNETNLQFLKTIINNRKSCKMNNYQDINDLTKSGLIDLNNRKKMLDNEDKNSDSSYEIKSLESIKDKNENEDNEEAEKINDTDKILTNEFEKEYPNTLSNLPPAFANYLKKKIIRKKYKNKKYYKSMCVKLIDTINNIVKNNDINNKIENEDINIYNNNSSTNNFNNIIYKNNNFIISNSKIIFHNNNDNLISTFSNDEQSNIFDIDNLSINRNDSFEIKSIYNNINIISNGQYENNKLMQEETELFIKNYKNNNENDINKLKISKTIENMLKNTQNLFGQSIEELSEIKSNSEKNNIKPDEKPVKAIISKPKKKSLKKYNSVKKNKNVTFGIKNINNSNKKRQTSIASINSITNSYNHYESSDNKIIKDNAIKNKGKKGIKKNKSQAFFQKILNKDDNKKDNLNKSQSRDYLNDINFINQENGFKNKNYEELREKTLNKLKTDNINRQKSGEKKSDINEEQEKLKGNCLII